MSLSDAFWVGFIGSIAATVSRAAWRSLVLRRMVRDFALFWRLAELRGVLACARIEARTGINAGDAAVMAVGALALIFVLAVVQGDASPVLAEQQEASQPAARATGARQQQREANEDRGLRPLVKQCGPWV